MRVTNMGGVLPDKLSELLLVALADLEQIEQDERYVVDMGSWHRPNGKCAVCLAGSVMARTLGVARDYHADPWIFGAARGRKLSALDALRDGDVWGALVDDLGRDALPATFRDPQLHLDCPRYEPSPTDWWNAMLGLVGILQAEKL